MTIHFYLGWALLGLINFVFYLIIKRTKSTLLWLILIGVMSLLFVIFSIGAYIIFSNTFE